MSALRTEDLPGGNAGQRPTAPLGGRLQRDAHGRSLPSALLDDRGTQERPAP